MYKRARKLFLSYIPTVVRTGILCRAPSLYDLLEIQPSSCTVLITNRCNLKCVMCRQWREPVGKELSTEEWKEIILDLRENGITNIHFSGGEPLLRKDLSEIIAYASKNGFTIGLTTNGILLKNGLMKELIDAGLRSVALSMDAAGSAYEEIRGLQNSFARVCEALSVIAEAKKASAIDAYINFTLMKNNIADLKDVKRLADRHCLPVAVCLLDRTSSIFDLDDNRKKFWLDDAGSFEALRAALDFLRDEKARRPGSLIINFPAIDFIESYFKDPRQENIPCVSSQDRIILDPYGNLMGGCMAMGTFGNIAKKPFGELRRDPAYRSAKRNMFYKRCAGCSCGYLFNIRCCPSLIVNDLAEKIRRRISGGA